MQKYWKHDSSEKLSPHSEYLKYFYVERMQQLLLKNWIEITYE